jgi:hypothetical protein
MNLSEIKEYPLSDTDIRTILGNDINMLSYPELENFNHIDQIFDRQGRCVLLFLTVDERTGHWLCLHKDKEDSIHYFDPYGRGVDKDKNWLSRSKLQELHQDKPSLMKLLRNSGKKVYFNTYDFQDDRDGINTCGRHCAVRLLFKDLDLEDYRNMIRESNLSPDAFVSKITFDIIKK